MLSKKNSMVTMVTDEFLENRIILQKSVATIGFIWFCWFQKCILLYIFAQVFLVMRSIRSHISLFRLRFTTTLITAYLLLRVNLDKIMHARWDFDASSARTRRVSALDKHQNWSASALFCLNSWAQSKYAVVNLIHTRRKQTFCLLLCDK